MFWSRLKVDGGISWAGSSGQKGGGSYRCAASDDDATWTGMIELLGDRLQLSPVRRKEEGRALLRSSATTGREAVEGLRAFGRHAGDALARALSHPDRRVRRLRVRLVDIEVATASRTAQSRQHHRSGQAHCRIRRRLRARHSRPHARLRSADYFALAASSPPPPTLSTRPSRARTTTPHANNEVVDRLTPSRSFVVHRVHFFVCPYLHNTNLALQMCQLCPCFSS